MTRNEILDFLKAHREELRQVYGVRKIALTNFFGLKRYLEEHLGRPVDLGIESTMKPIVKEAAHIDMLYV